MITEVNPGFQKFFDITLPIANEQRVWPGDPAVHIERVSDVNKGDSLSITRLAMGFMSEPMSMRPAILLGAGRVLSRSI
jgi:hypothetical protein